MRGVTLHFSRLGELAGNAFIVQRAPPSRLHRCGAERRSIVRIGKQDCGIQVIGTWARRPLYIGRLVRSQPADGLFVAVGRALA